MKFVRKASKLSITYHWLVSLFLCFAQSADAYAPKEGNITASIGPFYQKTNFGNSAAGPNNLLSREFGLLVLGDINEKSALELAFFHMDKSFFRHQGSNLIAEKTNALHITMGYRYWLNSFLSTALGFYSAYSMGDPAIIYSDYPPGQETDTSARDITEYGFDFSLQSDVGNINKFGIFIDLRYSYSVTSKENENGDHYGVFVGFRYLLQEKGSKLPQKSNPQL